MSPFSPHRKALSIAFIVWLSFLSSSHAVVLQTYPPGFIGPKDRIIYGCEEEPPFIGPQPAPPVDRAHSFISKIYVTPLEWFDKFFTNVHEDPKENQSYLRVVLGYEWINRKGFEFQRHTRAKVRLPALQDRASLVFSGEESDLRDLPTDRESVDQRTIPTRTTNISNTRLNDRSQELALRYRALDKKFSNFDLDLGTKSEFRTQVTARFRHKVPFSQKSTLRLSVNNFWLDRTGFGTRPRIEFERIDSADAVYRWELVATHLEEGPGLDWENRFVGEFKLDEKSGLYVTLGAYGPTQPSTVVGLYRTSVIYRRQFYREWLFYELEPGMQWERSFTDSYPPVATMGTRLEIRFQK